MKLFDCFSYLFDFGIFSPCGVPIDLLQATLFAIVLGIPMNLLFHKD